MTCLRSQIVRRALAAALMVVLMLGSVGRGLATVRDAEADPAATGLVIAGLIVPICHSGTGDMPSPGDPAQHDCCGPCLLGAVALLPRPPTLAEPVAVARAASLSQGSGFTPLRARERTPRQSQGPPVLR